MRRPRREGLSSSSVLNGTTTVVDRALLCMETAIEAPMIFITKGTNCSAKRRSTTRGSWDASALASSSMYDGTVNRELLMAALKRACLEGK
jgi:hypothetical protein